MKTDEWLVRGRDGAVSRCADEVSAEGKARWWASIVNGRVIHRTTDQSTGEQTDKES